MGLTDDAIGEFQTARNNPKRFVPSSSMLGICYMEKGLYSLAVDVLKNAVEKMEDRGECYWAIKYDLAEACEKNGNLKEALDHYTEVYGWNATFRAVSEKVNQVKKQLGSIAEAFDRRKGKRDRVSYL